MSHPTPAGPIGVFDSGYGGLTILNAIRRHLPQYSYLYLGDNARAPYGTRSFALVYEFTLSAVRALFDRGCSLVILACNTASAKALRSIQQRDLPAIDHSRRVLGVIRPTVEALGSISRSGHVGVLATPGTVKSHSYSLEIAKLYGSDMTVVETPCPMLVPLIENSEAHSPGARYFVDKYVAQALAADPETDTLVLGCTHYPLIADAIADAAGPDVRIVAQGDLVAQSLADYLQRHPEIETRCERGASVSYLTSEESSKFDAMASLFTGTDVRSSHISL